MRLRDSIRARLIIGATVVLMAFVVGAGLSVQRAHADSVRATMNIFPCPLSNE